MATSIVLHRLSWKDKPLRAKALWKQYILEHSTPGAMCHLASPAPCTAAAGAKGKDVRAQSCKLLAVQAESS
eukprot:s4860_g7.t1